MDDGVAAGLEMFGGVLIGRGITTMRFATNLAGTQVYPAATGFYTFHTFVGFGGFDLVQRRHMGTGLFGHRERFYALNIKIKEHF
jgi:hypothetical protein